MTRRQANTIIAGIVAVLFTQVLCTVAVLRGQERMRHDVASTEAAVVAENLADDDAGAAEAEDDTAAAKADAVEVQKWMESPAANEGEAATVVERMLRDNARAQSGVRFHEEVTVSPSLTPPTCPPPPSALPAAPAAGTTPTINGSGGVLENR